MMAWHVCYTAAQGEMRARHSIENLGFQTYVPQEVRLVRHARREREVFRVMLPRYLFVRFNQAIDHWWPINLIDEVEYFLGESGAPRTMAPSPIADDCIAVIRSAERSLRRDVKAITGLEVGENLKVTRGPLRGFYAVLVGVDDSARKVEAMLTMLGRPVFLKFSLADIEAS